MAGEQPGSAVSADALSTFGSQAAVHLRLGFERSRHPMLMADDRRRWVAANAPARQLLGFSALDVPWHTMDEFTTPDGRRQLREQWQAFLTTGAAEGWYELSVAERGTMSVEFSAIAHALPSRHLSVFIEPDADDESAERRAKHGSWAAVPADGARSPLTAREREVITLIAGGAQSGQIGATLFLSPETVNSHAHNAMVKLGARTRAHAVSIALVTGQIVWSMYDPKPVEPPGD